MAAKQHYEMPPNKASRSNRTLIDEFCTITGADKSLATSLLEACGNNLEMAINMHMEGIHGASASSNSDSAIDGARGASSMPRQEVLVEGPDELAFTFRGRRRVARSVFDKFRDFEAETKRQEEELLAGAAAIEAAAAAAGASTSSSTVVSAHRNRRKMKTLEDLFRPPIDLIYRGTFQTARDAGVSRKRWLMVNVQDSSEFPCQVLNRDVWSNTAVKTIVKEHFIFWQVYHDSEEGQRYMMFYQVSEWPHVAVLDPRTGECLITWHKLDAVTFCDLVTEFLAAHPGLDESTPPPKKPRVEMNDSILEADEASQIEAAIKASLAEDTSSKSSLPTTADEDEKEDSDTLETFDSDTDEVDYSVEDKLANKETTKRTFNGDKVLHKNITSVDEDKNNESNNVHDEEKSSDNENLSSSSEEGWKSYLGSPTDPESKLMLRLPDGSRDIVSMPSSSKLMALVKYVGSKGYSNDQYELVTNFPRREVSYLDFSLTLKEAGLFPQETVFIQAR
ncbi:UBX domain-containing protein 7-like [Homarus americanus]|uniref:UBX domain-containing protein 7-like n=1 Tax=Homarus americanus TaxID=6706 RepID=A0A8J5KM58_HOMAM|nr:UBX domain-containing protein 7-like [Homarus americanus]